MTIKSSSTIVCLSLLLLLSSSVRVALAQDRDLDDFEDLGRNVADAIASDTQFDITKLGNYKNLRLALLKQACQYIDYGYYRIKDVVYMIGSSKQGVVIGRHAKFNVIKNEANIESVTASAEDCLVIPNHPSSLGITVTEKQSETPTEFHVITNLVNGKALYVGTTKGNWRVVEGRISLLETHRL